MIKYVIPTTGDASKTVTSISKVTGETKIYIEGDHLNIFQKYNKSLKSIDIDDNDIIVFVHDDIEIRDEYIEKKLELYFQYKQHVGIAGVIGTNIFTQDGGWWLTNRNIDTRGRIIQGSPDGNEYPMVEPGGINDSNIVSVDGCILFMRGSIAKNFRFDSDTYNGYHFYDVDTCFTLMEQGWHVGIIDILVKHDSEGPLTESWYNSKDKFINKWIKKGYTFPITKIQFKNLNKRTIASGSLVG